jgi:PIN domain nuclease of toxin-antitoxin system
VRALVDTHVWLWMLTAPERLGSTRGLIAAADTELLLSAASSWEIAIKFSLGRLPLPADPTVYVPDRMQATGVTPVPVTHLDALEVAVLPPIHRDPFDRLLVAQARRHGVPIITADARIAAYDVETVTVM